MEQCLQGRRIGQAGENGMDAFNNMPVLPARPMMCSRASAEQLHGKS